ncbi:MAG TPA: SDR family oxidoreductase [Candidatus Brocadiia bacterium]|nr:SDR family oxidoreductase [Candidatus Brocadiia bacterium]
MDSALKELIEISRQVGSDPALVQGGGGNTSVKTADGRRMYVKASGTPLAEMSEGKGYRMVDVAMCVEMLRDRSIQNLPPQRREEVVLTRLKEACLDDLPGRPSVETSLHALLPKAVVHTHPAVLNGLLCCVRDRELLDELFGPKSGLPPFMFVPYGDPGYPLAVKMLEAIESYRKEHGRDPEIAFLANHGVFVAKPSTQEALEVTRDLNRRAEEYWRAERPQRKPIAPLAEDVKRKTVQLACAKLRALYSDIYGAKALVRFSESNDVADFMSHPSGMAICAKAPSMPDHYVYAVKYPILVKMPANADRLPQLIEKNVAAARKKAQAGLVPACVLVQGLGLFSCGSTWSLAQDAETVTHCAMRSAVIAEDLGGFRCMTKRQVDYLGEWEVERFRKALAAARDAKLPLAGRVALVTGAGSGLGRGISIHLAKAGAYLILADVDEQAAAETAEIIKKDGSPKATPMKADVTDESSVADLFYQAVCKLGGLDILVNAAGIAPAHALTDFPLAQWKKTLDINLTGYFLMGREAARVFTRQNSGGNIVNVASKTGLDASKSNSAYNATKAGEIHLARGWALELAPRGIRVNCVAPGNVFQGSKIWNPEYIKMCAAKRGIKPEEVIPYYISLSPLNKEITWEDVGNAVVFLCSDNASKITGQVLLVDGGQVMVR